MNPELVTQHLILDVIHGSHAYGTNHGGSDLDIKGVCLIPDKRLFLGLQNFEQQDKGWTTSDPSFLRARQITQKTNPVTPGPIDKVVYHLPKFIKLAGECNPNIIEVLFGKDDHILHITPLGKTLREHRHCFLSQKALHSFSGYAFSQLKRIKAKRRWITNPPTEPQPSDFTHVGEWTPIILDAPDNLQAIGYNTKNIEFSAQFLCNLPSHWRVHAFDENNYRAARRDWQNYQDWLTKRNPERLALEKEHSLDTKHAMHLVRLFRQGIELMRDGTVNVYRPDADELLEIRNGAWGYDELIAYTDQMDAEFQRYRDNPQLSPLSYAPNWSEIEKLQMSLIEEALG